MVIGAIKKCMYLGRVLLLKCPTSTDLDNLSGDDDADWVENLVNELNHCQPNNTYIKRQAVQPTRPVDRNGYTLQYGGNENGKRVVQYLEETPLPINRLVASA